MHTPFAPMNRSTVTFAKHYRAQQVHAADRSRLATRPRAARHRARRVRRLYDVLTGRVLRARTRTEQPPRLSSSAR
jgi:hypothetical protein